MDAARGNNRGQATMKNRAGKLRAGRYGSEDVVMPQEETVLGIRGTAVLYAPYGD